MRTWNPAPPRIIPDRDQPIEVPWAEMAAHPGHWTLIATKPTRGGASSLAHRISSRCNPTGHYRATTRDTGNGTFEVHACFDPWRPGDPGPRPPAAAGRPLELAAPTSAPRPSTLTLYVDRGWMFPATPELAVA